MPTAPVLLSKAPVDLEDLLAKMSDREIADDLVANATALDGSTSPVAMTARLLWLEAAKRIRLGLVAPNVPAAETVATPDSSNIGAFAYGASRLEITFKGGARYAYDDVSPEIFAAFKRAQSKGAFFAEAIKGRYPTTKLEPLPVPLSA